MQNGKRQGWPRFPRSLVYLNRQAVGVVEEGHLLPCEAVVSHRFAGNPFLLQVLHRLIYRLHPERQVPQAIGLRGGYPIQLPFHDEQFQLKGRKRA